MPDLAVVLHGGGLLGRPAAGVGVVFPELCARRQPGDEVGAPGASEGGTEGGRGRESGCEMLCLGLKILPLLSVAEMVSYCSTIGNRPR